MPLDHEIELTSLRGNFLVSVLGREEGYTVNYFIVYPDLSPNTDIIPFLTMIY